MLDSALLLEDLIKKANSKSDKKLIDKLSSESFIKSLNEVTEVFSDLGFSFHDNDFSSDRQKQIYLQVAKALVNNYFTLYYVNFNTGLYIGYSSNNDYKTLKIEEKGHDFFSDVVKNIPTSIYLEDQNKVMNTLTKDNLTKVFKTEKNLNISYRLLLNKIPTYVTLTAMRISSNEMIIGISNIDEITKREIEYKSTIKENLTYSNIAFALCRNYFIIYYVNIDTDEYIHYTLDTSEQKLIKIAEGTKFFDDSKVNAKKFLVPEDQEKFLYAIDKKNLLNELKNGKSLNLVYQQYFEDVPTYVSLKAIRLTNDDSHIVLAVSNINDQKKKESEFNQKYEQEKLLARTDGLTGCYNKNYYIEVENEINDKIKDGSLKEFSVVLCDINDLKSINDTYGHIVGDNCIIEAKNIISSSFKNSKVFRVGGDEFTLIITGDDFKNRENIISSINDINIKNKKEKKVVIAVGYADYNPNIDNDVLSVFRRADKRMYENKKLLKLLS